MTVEGAVLTLLLLPFVLRERVPAPVLRIWSPAADVVNSTLLSMVLVVPLAVVKMTLPFTGAKLSVPVPVSRYPLWLKFNPPTFKVPVRVTVPLAPPTPNAATSGLAAVLVQVWSAAPVYQFAAVVFQVPDPSCAPAVTVSASHVRVAPRSGWQTGITPSTRSVKERSVARPWRDTNPVLPERTLKRWMWCCMGGGFRQQRRCFRETACYRKCVSKPVKPL